MTDPKIKNIYSVTDDVPLEGDVNLYTLAIFSPEDGFSKGDKVAAFSIEDYKNRTFRDEADEEHPEKLENNMKLFNAYAEGGIEYLYEKFKYCQNTGEVVDELYQFVSDFAVKAGLKESEIDFIDFE